MKLLITAEVECDDTLYSRSQEEMDWHINDILLQGPDGELILHSNEIGDSIGTVKVLKAEVVNG